MKLKEFDRLFVIMSVLQQIKHREQFVNSIFFELLKNEFNILKNFNVELNDSVAMKFYELPDKWLELKKISIEVEEKILPIQKHQEHLVGKKIVALEGRINEVRESFKTLPVIIYLFFLNFRNANNFFLMQFFRVPCKHPYDLCNHTNQTLSGLEGQLKNLTDSADLFKINRPAASKLEICRKELQLIKVPYLLSHPTIFNLILINSSNYGISFM